MSYIGFEHIAKGVHSFPSEFTPEKAKLESPRHALAYCRAILGEYYRDESFIKYTGREKLRMLRAYGSDTQPESEAMQAVWPDYGKKKSTGDQDAREAWDNIDPRNLPIMSAFKQAILGKLTDIEYDIFADATDVFSTHEKEDMKYQMKADLLIQATIDQINKEIGVPKINDGSWKPKNLQEAEMYEQMGGFRLQAEYAIQKAIKHTIHKEMDWDRLKERIINELLDFGMAAVSSFKDQRSQLATGEFIDLEYAVAQYDDISEFESMKYGGYFTTMSIDDLRATGEFTESQLQHIAKMYMRQNVTDKRFSWNDFKDTDSATGVFKYGRFIVDVFKCRWRGHISQKKVKVKNQRGKTTRIETYDYTYELPEGSENEIYPHTPEMLYKATHVVGTDFVFDYGYDTDITRNSDRKIIFPMIIVKMDGLSFTERCISNIKMMNVIWKKYQNAVAKMRPKNVAIEYGAISSMSIKGQKSGPQDILRLYNNSGGIIYRATTAKGHVINNGAKPIYELEGGMGKALDEFHKMFEMQRAMMQNFSGLTPEGSGGAGIAERQSAELSNIQYNNAQDNLKPVINKFTQLKEKFCNLTSLRIQDIIRFSEKGRKNYEKILGFENVDSILLPDRAEGTLRDIGITIRIMPGREIRDAVKLSAMNALNDTKQDGSTIDYPDYMFILVMVQKGHIEDARRFLAMKINENKKAVADQKAKIAEDANATQIKVQEMAGEEKKAERKHQLAVIAAEGKNKIDETKEKGKQDRLTQKTIRGLDEVTDNEQSETNPLTMAHNMN